MAEYRILAFQQDNKSILFEVKELEYHESGKIHRIYQSLLFSFSKKDLCKKLKEVKKASEKPILWGNTSRVGQVYKKLKQKV